MARRFSLKDNPIFQKMEVPRSKDVTVESQEKLRELPTTEPRDRDKIESFEDQNLTLKNRPSKSDPQDLPLAELTLPPESHEVQQEPDVDQFLKTTKDIEGDLATRQAEEFTELHRTSTTKTPERESGSELHPKDAAGSNLEDDQKASNENLSVPKKDVPTRGSKFEGQILTLKNLSERSVPEDYEIQESPSLGVLPPDTTVSDTAVSPTDVDRKESVPSQSENSYLIDRIDKSEFFSIYNEVTDTLLPTLPPAEQILYSRLFRLSYGFNKNYCTVSHPLLRERTGLSRNTIRTGLQSLVKRQWLHVIEAGNHVSTTYRVILPREKEVVVTREGQNLTLKTGGSKFVPLEGQNLGVQKLIPKHKKEKLLRNNRNLDKRGSDFDPQNLTPLLLTNKSLTLSEREKNLLADKQYIQAATILVDRFYSQLSQTPSSAKRERSIRDCLELLYDGFSETQISYAGQWVINNLPTTGSFSRVVHLIDQALKSQEQEEETSERKEGRQEVSTQQQLSEKQREEEEQRIDEIRRTLPEQELEALTEEATALVQAEHGHLRYGRGTLILIKVRQLIKAKYLIGERG